jgi:hypothetical protein
VLAIATVFAKVKPAGREPAGPILVSTLGAISARRPDCRQRGLDGSHCRRGVPHRRKRDAISGVSTIPSRSASRPSCQAMATRSQSSKLASRIALTFAS